MASPRFTLELEFVLSLSNPYYLQHLATVYPHLFIPPTTSSTSSESDASKFAAYLSYLYNYWRTPEYAQYLTHPGAVLNTLKLLQQEQFRRDVIRPDVVEALLRGGSKVDEKEGDGVVTVQEEGDQAPQEGNGDGERMDVAAG
jgi:mediator of RNA polymerase II transcription subunit 31